MAEPGRGRGTGRGAALIAMLKNAPPVAADSPPSTEEPSPSSSVVGGPTIPRGRASLADKFKLTTPGAPAPGAEILTAAAAAVPKVGGRGALLSGLVKAVAPPAKPGLPAMSGEQEGVLGNLAALTLDNKSLGSTSSGPISRMGTDGQRIPMMSNYVNIKIDPSKEICRYDVKFDPETDSPRLRNALLNQHLDTVLGSTKTFDGTILYLPKMLPDQTTVLKSVRRDGVEITITVIFQRKFRTNDKDSITFFNILLNKVFQALKMTRINRHYFNSRCTHKVEEYKMELWAGFVTSIEEKEGGLKLNIDANHRVLRTETVRDYMKSLYDTNRGGDFRQNVIKELMSMTVLTKYNNKTYRIDDVKWDLNPSYEFERKKGEKTTIAEYFQTHWNLPISDMKQPLLLNRAKKRTSDGGVEETEILLVPELCYLTGMTEKIRNNFQLMRKLAEVTQVNPENRRGIIRKFLKDIENTPAAKAILTNWGVILEDDLVQISGRILPSETIYFGNSQSCDVNQKADWSNGACRNPVLRASSMSNWCIAFVQKDERIINEFVRVIQQCCSVMKIPIGTPNKIVLRNDSAQTYVNEIRKAIHPGLNMVVAVSPTQRNDRYAAIKKLCCVEIPVKSQVIMTKTIANDKKLKSVAEKIALQMNCKLGGALWRLKMPFEDVMIVGMDVYHASATDKFRGSVGAFVSSLDVSMTTWYSQPCFQAPRQEHVDVIKGCMVVALQEFYKRRGVYPVRIIVYRDGVGDGQLSFVADHEVKQIRSIFSTVEPSYSPKLTFIVVQKRINTRIMAKRGNTLENPPPGTIVDSDVTRRNWYDFILVPQNARQGTITPTHYIVLMDEANFKTDHIQRLTYKLCHLYYNWPGTIRVPAPCQYAHKLAYLVGQHIQTEPNLSLADSLYYL